MSAVKLRDFFESQGQTVLEANRKTGILSHIKAQTYSPSYTSSLSSMRHSWYFKTITSAALAFTLIYLLYTPLSGPLFDSSGDVLVARHAGNTVHAGYVGEIIATEGDITIVRQGVTTTTSQLQGGDVVYLYNTSKADFKLRDGSHGTMEGPAQFTVIENQDTGLILSINHARYMEIDKTKSEGNDTDVHNKEQLTIETNSSRIVTDENKSVHLALVTTQDRQLVQNKGDSVTIESVSGDKAARATSQTLAKSHVADVTDSIKVYEQVALIYQELTSKTLSQTYDLSSGEFAANDIKSLLAFEITINNDNADSATRHNNLLAHQYTTSTASRESNHIIIDSSISTDGSDQINLEEDDSLLLLALDGASRSHSGSSFVYEKSSSPLSRGDEQQVSVVLSDMGMSTTNENSTQVNTNNHDGLTILSASQLKLLHNSHKCINSTDLQLLLSSFNQSTSGSLAELIVHINTHYYLDTATARILASFYLCEETNE